VEKGVVGPGVKIAVDLTVLCKGESLLVQPEIYLGVESVDYLFRLAVQFVTTEMGVKADFS
jgi:hypothetical protein